MDLTNRHVPCICCRYDLFGTSINANCPECGRPTHDSLLPTRLVFARRSSLYGLLILMLVWIVITLSIGLITVLDSSLLSQLEFILLCCVVTMHTASAALVIAYNATCDAAGHRIWLSFLLVSLLYFASSSIAKHLGVYYWILRTCSPLIWYVELGVYILLPVVLANSVMMRVARRVPSLTQERTIRICTVGVIVVALLLGANPYFRILQWNLVLVVMIAIGLLAQFISSCTAARGLWRVLGEQRLLDTDEAK